MVVRVEDLASMGNPTLFTERDADQTSDVAEVGDFEVGAAVQRTIADHNLGARANQAFASKDDLSIVADHGLR